MSHDLLVIHTHTHGESGSRSRQCPDALGRVADVPHFDVGGGDGEDQAGAVADRHHVVGVTGQGHYLLTRHQVPHLTGPVCRRTHRQSSTATFLLLLLLHIAQPKECYELAAKEFAWRSRLKVRADGSDVSGFLQMASDVGFFFGY